MSIEEALGFTRPQLESEVESLRRRDQNSSPVKIIGRRVMEMGREGLKKLSAGLDIYDNELSGEQMEFNMRRLGQKDASLVILGASLISIEMAIVNMQYDHADFLATANAGLAGSFYPEFKDEYPGDAAQSINPDNWKEMIRIAREDKYFADFFKRVNQKVLPSRLLGFLEKNDFLFSIRSVLFPS